MNLNEIMQKLNHIKADDLKNINWNELKQRILSQPDLLICICFIITTVLVLYSSFTKYVESAKTSKTEIATLEKRLEAYTMLQSAQERRKDFLRTAPKTISSAKLFETCSKLANRHNLQVLSSLPPENRVNTLISVDSVELTLSCKNYKDLILLVRDLEKSSYPIRVKSVSVTFVTFLDAFLKKSKESLPKILRSNLKNDYIKATIIIEAVELKNV